MQQPAEKSLLHFNRNRAADLHAPSCILFPAKLGDGLQELLPILACWVVATSLARNGLKTISLGKHFHRLVLTVKRTQQTPLRSLHLHTVVWLARPHQERDSGEGYRERMCRKSQSWKVEDVTQLATSVWCVWCTERQSLLHFIRHIVIDFDSLSSDDKLVLVLDKGCQHSLVLKSRCGLLDFSMKLLPPFSTCLCWTD